MPFLSATALPFFLHGVHHLITIGEQGSTVTLPCGLKQSMALPLYMPISYIRHMVEVATGLPAHEQRYVLGGKPLALGDTLTCAGAVAGDTLLVLPFLP